MYLQKKNWSHCVLSNKYPWYMQLSPRNMGNIANKENQWCSQNGPVLRFRVCTQHCSPQTKVYTVGQNDSVVDSWEFPAEKKNKFSEKAHAGWVGEKTWKNLWKKLSTYNGVFDNNVPHYVLIVCSTFSSEFFNLHNIWQFPETVHYAWIYPTTFTHRKCQSSLVNPYFAYFKYPWAVINLGNLEWIYTAVELSCRIEKRMNRPCKCNQ